MDKLQMKTPLVEMDGDEMTRILWRQIKEELLEPYIDLKTEYYDLGLPHREETGDQVTIDAAKAAALADAGLAVSDVTFTKEKLDWDDGIAVYDIEFLTADTEYDYEIDAATGAVLDKSAELLRPNESPGQAMDAGIDVESAKEIAAAHAGLSKEEAFFTKAELELEHGRSEYEIEFYHDRIEYEYTIDAATGAILEYKSEYDH